MKKILITGALGQIGTELLVFLRKEYGSENVLATDVVKKEIEGISDGPFELLDATDDKKLSQLVDKYKVDTIYHLAALLSATAEKKPELAFEINLNGLFKVLNVAKEKNCQVFTPSSIGSFGDLTPKNKTPQDTVQRPSTMYGVTKVAGELLCDYYHLRFGLDTRGVRFPGLISYKTLPGGGTTDYAVDIFYEAVRKKSYTSFIAKGTKMDMMYMPDAISAMHDIMIADPSKLKHRNAFNITAMSFAPEELAEEIKKHIPEFEISYEVDPIRQAIANSWPDSLDDSCAREEWGWCPKYGIEEMTKDMLFQLEKKLK